MSTNATVARSHVITFAPKITIIQNIQQIRKRDHPIEVIPRIENEFLSMTEMMTFSMKIILNVISKITTKTRYLAE